MELKLKYIYKKSKVKFQKLSIDILILFIKLLILLKRLLTAFFVIILKPFIALAKFIFNNIIVKLYCSYLSLIKKLGWTGLKKNPFLFFISQKPAHIVIALLTIIIVFTNLVTKTKAVSDESPKNTIIADLVQSEFGILESEGFIDEYINEEGPAVPTQNYFDDLATLKDQPTAAIDPSQYEEDNPTVFDSEGLALLNQNVVTTNKIVRPRSGTIQYTVQPGDTISTIATQFGITVNTILWENNLTAYSLIRPGQSLTILPTSGISHNVANGETLTSIANKYNVDAEKIAEANSLGGVLRIGQKIVIPGGTKLAKSSPPKVAKYSGISAIKDLIVPPSAPAASNKMNWPTSGHRITQYFSWRHTGLDVANSIGTPIYAADSGTVEFAGWSTGYGNNIVVNHGGGKKTRYAHLSKFYAKKGAQVDKGQTIGAMGSTGWSTGSHLHFEVIINGARYNPLNYIK